MYASSEIYFYNWQTAKKKEINQPTTDKVEQLDNEFQNELLSYLETMPGIFSSTITDSSEFTKIFNRYASDLTTVCGGNLNKVTNFTHLGNTFFQAIKPYITINNELNHVFFVKAVEVQKFCIDRDKIYNLFSYDLASIQVKQFKNTTMTSLNIKPNNDKFTDWFDNLESGCHSLQNFQVFKHNDNNNNYVSFNSGKNTPGIMIKRNTDGCTFNIANNKLNEVGTAGRNNLLGMVAQLLSVLSTTLEEQISHQNHYDTYSNTLRETLVVHPQKHPLPPTVTIVSQVPQHVPLYNSQPVHQHTSYVGHSFFNQQPAIHHQQPNPFQASQQPAVQQQPNPFYASQFDQSFFNQQPAAQQQPNPFAQSSHQPAPSWIQTFK